MFGKYEVHTFLFATRAEKFLCSSSRDINVCSFGVQVKVLVALLSFLKVNEFQTSAKVLCHIALSSFHTLFKENQQQIFR